MSESTSTPPTTPMTMAEVWGMVQVSPSDAVSLLNSLAEANADRSPTLVTSLNDAIQQVLYPTTTNVQETPSEPTPSY